MARKLNSSSLASTSPGANRHRPSEPRETSWRSLDGSLDAMACPVAEGSTATGGNGVAPDGACGSLEMTCPGSGSKISYNLPAQVAHIRHPLTASRLA